MLGVLRSWLDVALRPPGAGGYSWWGPGQPDNAGGAELCAVADLTTAPVRSASKWFDQDCGLGAMALCRVTREWQHDSRCHAQCLLHCSMLQVLCSNGTGVARQLWWACQA
jgi:hypothetical protein